MKRILPCMLFQIWEFGDLHYHNLEVLGLHIARYLKMLKYHLLNT